VKINVKKISLVILILGAVCLMFRYAVSYWLGFQIITYYSFLVFFPFQDILKLVEFILFPILLFTWLISIIHRKDRIWTTAALAVILTLILVGSSMPDPKNLIIFGLKDRVTRDFKFEILRQFAREIDQLPTPPDLPKTLGKVYMQNDLNLAKIQRKKEYSFTKTASSITEKNGIVSVYWGRFQWGFSIIVEGEKTNLITTNTDTTIVLPVADDIFFLHSK
jgi:hypothetical protein